MKFSRKTVSLSFFSFFAISLAFFQNFTGVLLPHEVEYIESQARPLSQVIAETPGASESLKKIEIYPEEIVYIDRSIDVDQIIINGQLHCDPNAVSDIEIKAKVIYVNGLFQCGVNSARYHKKLTLSLKHSDIDPLASSAYRGLIVNNGGKLNLSGQLKNTAMIRLNATADIGHVSISLDTAVSNTWKIGDEIVIAPSSYDYTQGEVFKIKGFDLASSNIVHLEGSIKYLHYGLKQLLNTQRGELVLDQRAEVINLTRNIVIRADESLAKILETDVAGAQLGGHTMVNKGGFAAVDSVEFSRMGQAGIMARYPFHWHVVGNGANQFIKNSSIHRSFQRCVTIHQTNNTLVDNNVCYDFKGHGYFLEDGAEVDNTLSNNIGIYARRPTASKILLASDNANPASGVLDTRFPAVSVFWISNPQNTIINNIAAGSVGTGFWMGFIKELRTFDPVKKIFSGPIVMKPLNMNTKLYSGNIAHSTQVGHTWDGAPSPYYENSMKNPNNINDRKVVVSHYRPSVVPKFDNLVAYKNLRTGIYFRGDSAVFDNAVLADNGWSLFLAYNQVVKNSTVVGRSAHYGPFEEGFLYTKQSKYKDIQMGIVIYDGPFELENVDFLNFPTSIDKRVINGKEYDLSVVPFSTTGGTEKFTNIVSKLRFSPEPAYRAYQGVDTKSSSYRLPGVRLGGNRVRDLDGTFTGLVGGGNIVGIDSLSVSDATKCSKTDKKFYNFQVCPKEFNDATLTIFQLNSSDALEVPFVTRRQDGKLSLQPVEWDALDVVGLQGNKFSLINDPNASYELLFRNKQKLGFWITADLANFNMPVTKIVGAGTLCRLENLVTPAVSMASLNDLKAATVTSYFTKGNDLFIKLVPTSLFKNIVPNAHGQARSYLSPRYDLICEGDIVPSVVGYMNAPVFVSTAPDSDTQITGWACDYGVDEPINVKLFVGGAPDSASAVLLNTIEASVSSEPAVAFACGSPTNQGRRFKFVIPKDIAALHAGKKVYTQGIARNPASKNITLGYSGAYVMVGKAPLDIKGAVSSAVALVNTDASPVRVSGWACDYGKTEQITVELFVNGPKGTGVSLGVVNADLTPDATLSASCGVSDTLGRRFSVDIPGTVASLYYGKTLYAYGISKFRAAETMELLGSGSLLMPAKISKIVLSTSMVINESGLGDAKMLVDEQVLSGDILTGALGIPKTSWAVGTSAVYPVHSYIDLGREYEITSIYLRDDDGSGQMIISSGAPGSWTQMAVDPLSGFNKWNLIKTQTKTRYVRITKTAANRMNEILLYGR